MLKITELQRAGSGPVIEQRSKDRSSGVGSISKALFLVTRDYRRAIPALQPFCQN